MDGLTRVSEPASDALVLYVEGTNVRSTARVDQTIGRTVLYIGLCFWSVLALGPLLWMLYSSLKSNGQIVANVWALPNPLDLTHWVQVFTANVNNVPFIDSVINTMITGIPATVVVLGSGALAGYALARIPFRGAGIFQLFLLLLLPVPQFAVVVPVWSYMHFLGLVGSRLGLFFIYAAFNLALAITLMRGFFTSFPTALVDASLLDGCSPFGAFWRVIIPLSLGPLVTVGMITFGSIWNELLFSMTLIQEPGKMTIQPALAAYASNSSSISFGWSQEFAVLSVATLIPIALFLAFQDHVYRAVTLTFE